MMDIMTKRLLDKISFVFVVDCAFSEVHQGSQNPASTWRVHKYKCVRCVFTNFSFCLLESYGITHVLCCALPHIKKLHDLITVSDPTQTLQLVFIMAGGSHML